MNWDATKKRKYGAAREMRRGEQVAHRLSPPAFINLYGHVVEQDQRMILPPQIGRLPRMEEVSARKREERWTYEKVEKEER